MSPAPPSGPRLLVDRGDAETEEIPLRAGAPLVVGRSSGCDVRLDGDRVSRRHARIALEASGVVLEDLGSTTGTRVNGRTVQRKVLDDGDEIEIGTASLRLIGLAEGRSSRPGTDELLLALLTDLLAEDGETTEALLGRVLEGLTEVFEADRGALFLPGDEGLEAVRTFTRPGSPLTEDMPVSSQLVAKAASESDPTLLTTSETRELQESIRSIPRIARSVLAAPLPHPDGAGVLYLDSVLERREFHPGDGELLLAFARAAGLCLTREAERLRDARLAELQRRGLEAHTLIGDSPPMLEVKDEIAQAAESDVTVLVTGESGTGKELVAQALHRQSPRAAGPFVAVNCAAIPSDLVESELFGHERGAFTGAEARRLGHFELAHGGTLFLDEVGELPAAVQGKLLRALQERTVRRLGGSQPVPVDFRLVCATNVDLEEAVQQGRFREDLFYRVAVFRIRLPPLRERGDDVLAIAERFLAEFAREFRRGARLLAPETRAALSAHSWPGNVRELRNVIEQAVVRERGEALSPASVRPALGGALPVPEKVSGAGEGGGEADWLDGFPVALDEARRTFEGAFLARQLKAHKGNMKATAAAIGLSRRGLYDKCEELGIDYKSFR